MASGFIPPEYDHVARGTCNEENQENRLIGMSTDREGVPPKIAV